VSHRLLVGSRPAHLRKALSVTGRRRLAIFGAAIAAAIAIAVVVVMRPPAAHHDRAPTYAFTAADRAPLVVDGQRLRHPTLGFSLGRPGGGFFESPKLVEYLAGKLGSDTVEYGYVNPDHHASLMIVAMPATGSDADALATSLDRFVHAMDPNAAVEERVVGSNDGRVHYRPKGGHVRAEVHLVQAGTGWVHVIVAVGSIAADYLADELASFQSR